MSRGFRLRSIVSSTYRSSASTPWLSRACNHLHLSDTRLASNFALNPAHRISQCVSRMQISSFPPSAASLCRIPTDVLSSCVLPLLDVTSLVRVARCSRLLLSAADCAAAWSHSLLAVSLDHLVSQEVLRSLVLRRARLSLRDDGSDIRSLSVQRLFALPPGCQLVSLDISTGPPSLLTQPSNICDR